MNHHSEPVYAKRLVGTISAQGDRGVILVPVKTTVSVESAIKTANQWLSVVPEFAVRTFAVRAGHLNIADQIRERYNLADVGLGNVTVVHVCGFDLLSAETLNDMCSMLNRDRDILALVPAILVFWLNDTALAALARRAPFFISGSFHTIDLWDGFDDDESVKVGREQLVSVLSRFPFCVRRESRNLVNEADVQRILWTILRSHYDDVLDEEHLPKVGIKQYRIDFGIRHLRIVIEAKFVRPNKSLSELQDELFADLLGYFSFNSNFEKIIFFIYDSSSRQHEWPPLISALKAKREVLDVLVVPYVRLE